MASRTPYINRLSARNRLGRSLWGIVYITLFRFSPTFLHAWRRIILRCFGAKVGEGSHPYPKCRIWAPWNLSLGKHSCLANFVDCYTVDRVNIGDFVTVSQYTFLCTATHDYNSPSFPLTHEPITVGDHAWICGRAYVGPGITIGQGAVVAACAVVTRDIEDWTVVGGHPAKTLANRKPMYTTAEASTVDP